MATSLDPRLKARDCSMGSAARDNSAAIVRATLECRAEPFLAK
jgi:hypothetical protein